jgi:hypothetical protein
LKCPEAKPISGFFRNAGREMRNASQGEFFVHKKEAFIAKKAKKRKIIVDVRKEID